MCKHSGCMIILHLLVPARDRGNEEMMKWPTLGNKLSCDRENGNLTDTSDIGKMDHTGGQAKLNSLSHTPPEREIVVLCPDPTLS